MVKIETTLPNEKKTKKKSKKKNGKHTRLTVLLVLGILFIFALAFGYWLYKTVMSPNVQTTDGKEVELFIPTGSDYNQVKNLLAETHCITNEKSFDWVAQKKELPANIHPGHYILKNGMSNNLLVNMLRGGLQTPVKVKFNNMRDVDQLAGRIAQQIEADSASIANLLHNQQYVNQLGFNPYTLPSSCPTHTNSIGTPMPKASSTVYSRNTTSSGMKSANNKLKRKVSRPYKSARWPPSSTRKPT